MLETESYHAQLATWPSSGHHIMAQFDEDNIVVYQAYRTNIGRFATKHQHFGGDFKLSRMSWIKPNFLWMMYRCGWGTKPDQEVVLAITLRREAFESILRQAIHSTYMTELYGSYDEWKQRLGSSSVRLQWDPDHDPYGVKQERRAIQLGLSGDILRSYSCDWIQRIEDISDFVARGRAFVAKGDLARLSVPRESVFPVKDPLVVRHLGVTPVQTKSERIKA